MIIYEKKIINNRRRINDNIIDKEKDFSSDNKSFKLIWNFQKNIIGISIKS